MRPILGFALLSCLVVPAVCRAQTHDWSAVQAIPRETRVIVHETSARGGTVRGRMLLANDSEITVLRSGRPVVVPRHEIGRIDTVRRDPVWRGFIIGALWGLVARATYGAEACTNRSDPGCTLNAVAVMGGLGALVDLSINDERTVYRAPAPAVTMLRLSF